MDQQLRPPLTGRLTRRQLIASDVLLAVLLGQVLVSAAVTSRRHAALPLAAGLVLAALGAGTIAARRWRPWPVFVVSLAVSTVCVLAGFTKDPLLAPALVLYVVVAGTTPRNARVALLAAEGCIAATAAASWVVPSDSFREPAFTDRVLGAAVVQSGAWMIGETVRRQRAYTRLERVTAAQRLAIAQARIAEAEQAVVEERLRIAQELHDVTAHSMSVIAVQAGVGHHVAASQPDQAARALAAIETTSRDALQEMRRLLGMLRDGTRADCTTGDPADLLPAPRLADLPALVAVTEQAGLRVVVHEEGTPRPLHPGLELAAYRIVQEALTNVVKHAGTTDSRVVIGYRQHELTIEVTDRGNGPPDGWAAGHGLIGMRERVALYEGRFTAGPVPDGGFRVTARLPSGPAPAAVEPPTTLPPAAAVTLSGGPT